MYWNSSVSTNNKIRKPLSLQVVCKKYREFTIPKVLKGLKRYLDNAYKQDEFRFTCPKDSEILIAYESVAKHLNKIDREGDTKHKWEQSTLWKPTTEKNLQKASKLHMICVFCQNNGKDFIFFALTCSIISCCC